MLKERVTQYLSLLTHQSVKLNHLSLLDFSKTDHKIETVQNLNQMCANPTTPSDHKACVESPVRTHGASVVDRPNRGWQIDNWRLFEGRTSGKSKKIFYVFLFFLLLPSGVSMRAIASSFMFQILANLVLWMCK